VSSTRRTSIIPERRGTLEADEIIHPDLLDTNPFRKRVLQQEDPYTTDSQLSEIHEGQNYF
jgi:hypothetical protein